MYSAGDTVIYGIHGVCKIAELEEKTVDRQKVLYYVLEPLDHPGAKYYIPTGNQAAVSKLNPLLSLAELDALLKDCSIPEGTWVCDENRRKQRYRELLNSGDRRALLAMVRALREYRTQQLVNGKKFHLCDENFLRDAEKLLCSEFAVVLNTSYSEAAVYMEKYL